MPSKNHPVYIPEMIFALDNSPPVEKYVDFFSRPTELYLKTCKGGYCNGN